MTSSGLQERLVRGRSASGGNPRMRRLDELSDDQSTEGDPDDTASMGPVRQLHRTYSLNEAKLQCMRVRQTSFEMPSDLPLVGKVRTRRWSTSWRIPMGEWTLLSWPCWVGGGGELKGNSPTNAVNHQVIDHAIKVWRAQMGFYSSFDQLTAL